MNQIVAEVDDASAAELDRLAQLGEDVIKRARQAGASAVEVGASVDTGLSVNVRMGEVETLERTRDRGLSLTVYFGQRKGSASTADLQPESITATLDQACAIARFTEPDPCAGLADAGDLATVFPDLDLWHPWAIDAKAAIELGREVEAAGRAVAGIENSEGASVDTSSSLAVYANSLGFCGRERSTGHSLSCSLIAGKGDAMQRDGWYDTKRVATDLSAPAAIGRKAAKRALAHVGARRLTTRECPVLFAPEVARGVLGHLLGAVSGGALYREASFLLDACGKQILPTWLSIAEQPLRPRGFGSASFDADGVAPTDAPLVADGVLARYLLSSYSARQLGLKTTGNAGGIHNLVVSHGDEDFAGMLRQLGTGLLVTDVMGQGVSIVTGDYSRGASGFWVENGAIAYPVQEITIAANLRDMLTGIVAIGNDIDYRSQVMTGSILIDHMTIAGE